MIIQSLRGDKLKLVVAFFMVLMLPSLVLFYGFDKSSSGDPLSSERPLVTVTLPDGTLREMGREDLLAAKGDLQRYYLSLYEMFFGFVPPQLAQQIPSKLTNEEVARHAVATAAKEYRLEESQIVVSQDQVVKTLAEAGLTKQQLDAILTQNRMSQHQYLVQQAGNITRQRAVESIQAGARLSLYELWTEYTILEERLTVEFVEFNQAEYAETIELTEADLQKEFEETKINAPQTITKREERTYEYVKVPAPATPPAVEPTEEEIAAAYAAMSGPGVELGSGALVRHILVGIDTAVNAGTPLAEAARLRAEEARAEAIAGNDFAATADFYSDDLRNQVYQDTETSPTLRGGLLPTPISGTETLVWGEDYIDFVKTSEPGTVSPVIETPLGYAVVKVEERGDSLRKPLSLVRDEILATLRLKKAEEVEAERKRLVAELVQKVREVAATQSTLAGIATEFGVEVATTAPVQIGRGFITGVGDITRDRAYVEELIRGEISPPIATVAGDVVVLRLQERSPERLQTLDEARAVIELNARRARAVEAARAAAEELRGRLTAEDRLTSVALEMEKVATSIDEPFTRAQPPEELRKLQNFSNATLGKKAGDLIIVDVVNFGPVDGVALARINSVESPTREKFFSELQQMEMRFLSFKRQGALEDFYADALSRLKAKFDPDFVGTDGG